MFRIFTGGNSHFNNQFVDNGFCEDKCDVVSSCDDAASSDSDGFFELFGLKLYFDDVLIICILFFLYSEGVKDNMLFVSLLLLLLS